MVGMNAAELEHGVEQMHHNRPQELEEYQGYRIVLHGEGHGANQAVTWLCCLPLMGSDSKDTSVPMSLESGDGSSCQRFS